MTAKRTSLDSYVDINPEGITKSYPHDLIEYIDISSVGTGYMVEYPRPLKLSEAPSRAKRIVRNGDTILATVRPNLRSFLYVTQANSNTIASTGFAVLRAKCNADPRFVYYAVTDPRFTGYLTNNTKGTSYPAVDSDTVLRGEVPRFTLEQQRRISAALSGYDNLIENNRRRIQLLEESARLLYKEWFVHLRFPGHEHVKVIDGVPERWEAGAIGDLGEVITGKTPSKKKPENFGSDLPFIKTPDIHGNAIVVHTEESLSEEGAKIQAKKTLPPRSVLVSCIGTVGAVAFNASQAQTNQQINSIVPTSESVTYWVYFMAKELKPLLEGMGGGATMANVNKSKFSGIKIVIPSKQLLELFSKFAKLAFDQIENLTISNARLAKARDLLLPRLMNGEIAV